MLSSSDDCMIRHSKASRRYGVFSHHKVSFWVLFLKEDKMIIKEYNYLPEEARKIRTEVFLSVSLAIPISVKYIKIFTKGHFEL
jgi:hypothetical protein